MGQIIDIIQQNFNSCDAPDCLCQLDDVVIEREVKSAIAKLGRELIKEWDRDEVDCHQYEIAGVKELLARVKKL